MCPTKWLAAAVLIVIVGLATPTVPVLADTATCKKAIVKQLFRYERVYLRRHARCLDRDNKGDIGGTDQCPDLTTQTRIQDTNTAVTENIADKCTISDIAALGYRADCVYGPETTGIEADCAALPVTTPTEFAECMKCWKSAELAEYLGLLYASQSVGFCGGSLDATSPVCSELGCTVPLPEQRDLGDTGENDCQIGIGRSGARYLVNRMRILERCLLEGGNQASCLADPDLQTKLATQEARKETSIKRKCGNRTPSVTSNFCCRCGPMGGTCTQVPTTREDCLAIDPSCKIQEGKLCNLEGDPCANAPKEITWWVSCPKDGCSPATPLASIDDVIACVDASADVIADELLCLQFPTSYPCATATPAPTTTPTPTPTSTP
jgi:hypothetical protein